MFNFDFSVEGTSVLVKYCVESYLLTPSPTNLQGFSPPPPLAYKALQESLTDSFKRQNYD